MQIIPSNKRAVINNLLNIAKAQLGEAYFVTEKDIAAKYNVSVEDVILAEKAAIPLEMEVQSTKERRLRILNNLFQHGLEYYKEVESSTPVDFTDAFVINEHKKLLLLKRSDSTDIEPNKWCLPGGHAEKFLSKENNILKELKEETGLTPISCVLFSVKKIKGGRNIYYFVCSIPKDAEVILDENEHKNYKYFSLKEIKDLPAEEFIFDLKDYLLQVLGATTV